MHFGTGRTYLLDEERGDLHFVPGNIGVVKSCCEFWVTL